MAAINSECLTGWLWGHPQLVQGWGLAPKMALTASPSAWAAVGQSHIYTLSTLSYCCWMFLFPQPIAVGKEVVGALEELFLFSVDTGG